MGGNCTGPSIFSFCQETSSLEPTAKATSENSCPPCALMHPAAAQHRAHSLHSPFSALLLPSAPATLTPTRQGCSLHPQRPNWNPRNQPIHSGCQLMAKGALWGGTHSWYSEQTLHLGLISAQGVVGALFPPGTGALRAGLKDTATKKAIVGPSREKGRSQP